MTHAGILSLVVLLAFGGCSKRVVEGPPVVKYGQDECALCGMIVNEDRFAAALLIEKDGARSYLHFDDIGDLIQYEEKHHPAVVSRFVHDFNSRQWTVAEDATFVVSETLHTPMGSGIVAFRNNTDATSKAAEANGKVKRWQELQAAHSSIGKNAACYSGDAE